MRERKENISCGGQQASNKKNTQLHVRVANSSNNLIVFLKTHYTATVGTTLRGPFTDAVHILQLVHTTCNCLSAQNSSFPSIHA